MLHWEPLPLFALLISLFPMEGTCIVIPCFNEAARLPVHVFSQFLKREDLSICFVNDGSTDETPMILRNLKEAFPEKVEVLELSNNSGKAEAVRLGVLKACLKDEFKFVGFLDADLATPLEEVEYLLHYFQPNVKVVIGARVLRLGAVVERSAFRHYTGRVFATMANNILNLKVYDSQCGAKIFRCSIAKELFSNPFQSRWLFDLELLYRLKKKDSVDFEKNIVEIPLRTWREKGNSKLRFKDFIFAPFELLKIRKAQKAFLPPKDNKI